MRKAFTLAEVLITLTIIGVVAAITMPIIITKHREQVTVNKLKKFYSTFSQAYLMAINEYGTIDNWGLTNSSMVENEQGVNVHSDESNASYKKFFDIMGKYMKIIKYERLPEKDMFSCYLPDGVEIVAMWLNNLNACTVSEESQCGDFYVRIGGKTADNGNLLSSMPNYFVFRIYKNKIVPHGSTTSTFNTCKNHTNLTTCTAWVLYNGNMDYLHCPDELSWGGKTKCK